MRILILSNSHLASLYYAFIKMKSIGDLKAKFDFCGIVGGGFNRCEFSDKKLHIKDSISNAEKIKISKEMLATYGNTMININSYDYIIIYSLGLSLNNYIASLTFRSDINGVKAFPLLSSKAVLEIYNRYLNWCPAAHLFSVLGPQLKGEVFYMSGPLLNGRTVDLESNKLVKNILADEQIELFSNNYWSFVDKVSSLNNVSVIRSPKSTIENFVFTKPDYFNNSPTFNSIIYSKESFYSNLTTHGNVDYGEIVLKNLINYLSVK